MADGRAYLEKAIEALAGAESEAEQRRYNNAANRLYYACFLAAIAALIVEGVNPDREGWSHATVQAQFNGLLIDRRHVFSRILRGVLNDLLALREQSDYSEQPVSGPALQRLLRRGKPFVEAVKGRVRI